MKESKFL